MKIETDEWVEAGPKLKLMFTEEVESNLVFAAKSTKVLHVTASGEFQWHPDAERLIETCDSPAIQHVLRKLWTVDYDKGKV